MEELASVYSRALFESASEHDRVDEIKTQLGQFADALDADRELSIFFFSPYFSTQEKEDGLMRALEDAEALFVNFLRLLIEKHRMPVIFRIRREYERLWEQANQLLPVQVTSAVELDKSTIDAIGARIGERTGRRVELTTSVDPEILGGVVLRVGNAILDASIRNRLEQLRKQVAQG